MAVRRTLAGKKESDFRMTLLCLRNLFSRLGQLSFAVKKHAGGMFLNGKEKEPSFRLTLVCWHYLSSRAVTRQVLSAQMSLTSVFGMGTGGPT